MSKSTRRRSPNYPAISLPEAIELTRKLVRFEAAFSPAEAAAAIGRTINGATLSVLAAIRSYGLLKAHQEHLIVTSDAVRVIALADGSAERTDLIRRLALMPEVFEAAHDALANMTEDGFRLPPDDVVQDFLEAQGFTPRAIDTCVASLKATYSYAFGEDEPTKRGTLPKPQKWDLGGGARATLTLSRPISKRQADALAKYIAIYVSTFDE